MEPNKLEKYIQKQLEGREIQPSPEAWERIAGKLDAPIVEKSSNRNWYLWAACGAILVVLSLRFFAGAPEEATAIQTVEGTSNKKVKSTPEAVNAVPSVIDPEPETQVAEQQPIGEKKISEPETFVPKQLPTNPQVSEVAANQDREGDKAQVAENKAQETLMDAKIAEVVAQVEALENQHQQVSDAEVDSLLYRAQRELLANKIFQEGKKVDAMALLDEVEQEIDRSFRDDIFEKLKSGFIKVRTAVADRNQ